jgi:pimeloyl-ACP methyl ester carboxylesterase
MKKFSFVAFAAFLLVGLFAVCESYGHDSASTWVWKSTSAVENNPGIIHYTWEMARPPHGPFDKIALHRFVYDGDSWRKRPHRDRVLLHLPGTWDTAWKGITDPRFENHIFFANNGYDVYSLDYRTSYLPKRAYNELTDISGTGLWTYGLFREDIKACVEKIKHVSNTKKIFLSGFSRGGTHLWIYASKYGKSDLKGLIGLDGGAPFASFDPAKRTTAAYDAAVNAFFAGGADLLSGSTTFDGFTRMQFAGAIPDAKKHVGYATLNDCMTSALTVTPTGVPITYYNQYGAPPVAINTVADLQAYFYNFAWNYRVNPAPTGYGILTNYYGGQMDKLILMQAEAGMTFYWPAIQNVERINDLDYADNVPGLKLPVIFFGGTLNCGYDSSRCVFSNPVYKCASSDVTVVLLTGFGHMDVMWGLNSQTRVKEPLLDWMNRRQ